MRAGWTPENFNRWSDHRDPKSVSTRLHIRYVSGLGRQRLFCVSVACLCLCRQSKLLFVAGQQRNVAGKRNCCRRFEKLCCRKFPFYCRKQFPEIFAGNCTKFPEKKSYPGRLTPKALLGPLRAWDYDRNLVKTGKNRANSRKKELWNSISDQLALKIENCIDDLPEVCRNFAGNLPFFCCRQIAFVSGKLDCCRLVAYFCCRKWETVAGVTKKLLLFPCCCRQKQAKYISLAVATSLPLPCPTLISTVDWSD